MTRYGLLLIAVLAAACEREAPQELSEKEQHVRSRHQRRLQREKARFERLESLRKEVKGWSFPRGGREPNMVGVALPAPPGVRPLPYGGHYRYSPYWRRP